MRSCRRGSGSLGAARRCLGELRRAAPAGPGGVLSLRPSRGRRTELPRPAGSGGRAEGGALPAPRLPAHTQAADGGGGWLCQTHTHTHTRQRLQLSSPSQDVSAVHDCSHFSTLASKPHCEHKTRTQPLFPAPQPRTRQIEPCRCLGGGRGGAGGSARLGSARHGSARLGPARPGASRRGQARRRALGSDQAEGSCVALFPALRSPNV